jgi:hypothetical protein
MPLTGVESARARDGLRGALPAVSSEPSMRGCVFCIWLAARATKVVNDDGQTVNLPDDDELLEAGGDGQCGPGWMELWSSVSHTARPPALLPASLPVRPVRGFGCALQACKHAAAAIEASRGDKTVALAPADEFNVAFMEGSSHAYNAAAGLTGSFTAKL